MTTTGHSPVVGIFESHDQAWRAIVSLREAGFADEQIGVIWQGESGGGAPGTAEIDPAPAEGAVTGAVSGGTLGGLLGAATAMLVPGIGPVLAGGILASLLTGAAVGAATGGLLGGLAGLGIPEAQSRYYVNELRAGRLLLTVQAGERYEQAFAILRNHGAYNAEVGGSGATSGSAATGAGASETGASAGSRSVGGAVAGTEPASSGTSGIEGMIGSTDSGSQRGDTNFMGVPPALGGSSAAGSGTSGSEGMIGSGRPAGSRHAPDSAASGSQRIADNDNTLKNDGE